MTDEDQRPDDPDFDDPSFDQLRALLGSARVDEPVPADVVARLDATLTDLVDERASGSTVVPLRRRPKLAPRLLVAAVAVVLAGVGGVGLNEVLDNGHLTSNADSDSAASGATADRGLTGIPESAPQVGPQSSGDGALPSGNADKGALNREFADSVTGSVPVFTTKNFAAQAAKFKPTTLENVLANLRAINGVTASAPRAPRDQNAPAPSSPGSIDTNADSNWYSQFSAGGSAAELSKNLRLSASTARSCPGPRVTGATSYPLVLDRRPAVLVVHRPSAGKRLIEAWSCTGDKVLAFALVPR